MRGLGCAALACAVAWVTPARADDETVRTKTGAEYRGEVLERVPGDHVTIRMPGSIRRIEWGDIDARQAPPGPTEPSVETVRMRDGSVIRGELVEKLAGDHVVVRIATGAMRRVEWRDLDPTPAPPPPATAPETVDDDVETVRTQDGSVYRGAVIEKVVGDHVLLRLVTGAIRRIEWRDLDMKPPPASAQTTADVETVRTRKGDVYRGEVVEKIVDDHVVIRMALGKIQRIEWADIEAAPRPLARRKMAMKEREPVLTFHADDEKATLQRFDEDKWEYTDVCTSSCTDQSISSGLFRVTGEGLASSKPFPLRGSRDNHVTASMVSRARIAGGATLIALGSPVVLVGTLVAFAGIGQLGDYYASPGNVIAVGSTLALLGAGILVTGIVLVATARSSLTVNDHVATLRLPGRTELGVDGLHF